MYILFCTVNSYWRRILSCEMMLHHPEHLWGWGGVLEVLLWTITQKKIFESLSLPFTPFSNYGISGLMQKSICVLKSDVYISVSDVYMSISVCISRSPRFCYLCYFSVWSGVLNRTRAIAVPVLVTVWSRRWLQWFSLTAGWGSSPTLTRPDIRTQQV